VYARGGFITINPAPERGQFSSLQVGLQDVLNRGRDAAIVTLVDRPPARPQTVAALCERFADAYAREKWAVVPEFGSKHGHPIVIGREMIHAFLSAPATGVARNVEHQHQHRIEYVPVDDPFVTMNVDTPADYDSLLQHVK
jgi:molybdenum cofactor cytidylyltransferase